MSLIGWGAFPTYVAGQSNPIFEDLDQDLIIKAEWFGQKWCTFCFNRDDAVNEAAVSWSRGEAGCMEWKVLQVEVCPEMF